MTSVRRAKRGLLLLAALAIALPLRGTVSFSTRDTAGSMRANPGLALSLAFAHRPVTEIWNGHSGQEFSGFGKEQFVDWSQYRWWRFRWQNPFPHAARGEWQVLIFEPGSQADWRDPPGLVARGVVEGAPHGDSWREFEIGFDPWAPTPPNAAPAKPDEPTDLELIIGILDLIDSLQDDGDEADSGSTSASANRPSGAMSLSPVGVDAMPFASADPRVYWVRVLPLSATGEPAGPPSSPARLVYGTPDPPQFDWTDDPDAPMNQARPEVEIVEYQPIRWADDPHLWWLVTRPVPFLGHEEGDKVYWDPHQQEDKDLWDHIGDGIGSVVSAFESAVNWVSGAYDDIKSFAVSSVADTFFPNCDPCRTALAMGLDYGLASVGIPPSLPNFDDLTEMGKGYLVESIAAETGLPPEAVERAVDELAARAKEVADHGPGGDAWLRPHPDHQFRPAFVRVRVTNNANDWRRGSLSVRMGHLYQWRSVPVPPLGPGESIVVPVVLTQETDYWIRKWIREHDGAYAGSSAAMRAWWEAYEGPPVDLAASFSATGPRGQEPGGGQSLSLDPDTTYVGSVRYIPFVIRP